MPNDGITTKGDANNTEDSTKVADENFIGKTLFWLPHFGKIVLFAHSRKGKIVLVDAFLFFCLPVSCTTISSKRTPKSKMIMLMTIAFHRDGIPFESGDRMKNRLLNRLTSAATALIMFVNASMFDALVVSEGDGVGIYNHVMTSDKTTKTEYVLTFYKGETTVKLDAEMIVNNINNSERTLVPSSDKTSASIELGVDEKIVFSNNAAFQTFVKNNEIDKIVIAYQTKTLNLKETSLLYSPKVQIFDFTTENNKLDYTKSNPFSDQTFLLKQFRNYSKIA